MTGRPVDAQRRQERQDAFLAAFARTGILTMAGEEAGIPAPQHHAWVKNDPEYAERFALTKAAAEAAGVADANRRPRARNGNYGGERGAAKLRNQEKFLEVLARTGIALDAAAEAGVVISTYHYWMRSDPEFAGRAAEAARAGEPERDRVVGERRGRGSRESWNPERSEAWGRRQREEFWTPERRAEQSAKMRERLADPEIREARSRVARERWADPEFRERESQRISGHMRERWLDPAFRARFGAAMRRPEVRQRLSEVAKATWAAMSPEERERRRVGMSHARRTIKGGHKVSKIEAAVMTELNDRDLPYFVHKHIAGYFADILVSSLSLVIECDGAYCHDLQRDTDAIRDVAMLALGYETLRLSQEEINEKNWARLDETIARLSRASA